MNSTAQRSTIKIIFSATLLITVASLINHNFTTKIATRNTSNNDAKDDGGILFFHPDKIPMLTTNKTFIVTGANSGIGLSTVKILARAGTANLVIMACRNMTRCSHARDEILSEIEKGRYHEQDDKSEIKGCRENICINGDKEGGSDARDEKITENLTKRRLVAMHLDLSSLTSVRSFSSEVQAVLSSFNVRKDGTAAPPPLDVLINNGGIMGTLETLKDTVAIVESESIDMEPTLMTNHLGHFALTSLLLPNLENSMFGGRVVSVSSTLAAIGPYFLRFDDLDFSQRRQQGSFIYKSAFIQGGAAYAVSKMANLLFAHGLHKRYAFKLEENGRVGTVTSVSAHPGYTRTKIIQSGWSNVHPVIGKIMRYHRIGTMHPDDGAMPQIRAALDVDGVKSDDYVGPLCFSFGRPIVLGTNMRSMHHLFGSFREEDVDSLWRVSEDAMGWSFNDGIIY